MKYSIMEGKDRSESTNPQPDKEITGNSTFQINSFLEDNNQFLVETNKLIGHYNQGTRKI